MIEVYVQDMIEGVADALDRINETPEGADPAPTARPYYDVDGRNVSPTEGARIAGQRIWDSVNEHPGTTADRYWRVSMSWKISGSN
ncbi:hypothetical protein ACWEK5_28455 [Rhodococcus koreensis]